MKAKTPMVLVELRRGCIEVFTDSPFPVVVMDLDVEPADIDPSEVAAFEELKDRLGNCVLEEMCPTEAIAHLAVPAPMDWAKSWIMNPAFILSAEDKVFIDSIADKGFDSGKPYTASESSRLYSILNRLNIRAIPRLKEKQALQRTIHRRLNFLKHLPVAMTDAEAADLFFNNIDMSQDYRDLLRSIYTRVEKALAAGGQKQ